MTIFDAAAIEIDTLPSVEDAGRGAFMGAVLPSLESFVPLLGPVDGKLGVDLERGMLVDGRRPGSGCRPTRSLSASTRRKSSASV